MCRPPEPGNPQNELTEVCIPPLANPQKDYPAMCSLRQRKKQVLLANTTHPTLQKYEVDGYQDQSKLPNRRYVIGTDCKQMVAQFKINQSKFKTEITNF